MQFYCYPAVVPPSFCHNRSIYPTFVRDFFGGLGGVGGEIIVGYKQYLFYNLVEYQDGFRRGNCCAGYVAMFVTTQLIKN